MSALDDFRMKNPGAASLSDAELIGRISSATGIDPGTVAADFGVQINDPGFVSTLKRSGAQMVGGVGEIYGDVTGNRNNAASRWAEDVAFRNPSGINSLADVAENPWLAAKEAVGNAATFLVPGAGLKIAGNVARGAKMLNTARALDNPLTQAAVAGLPSLSEIGESQRESGQPENYTMKYLGAGAVGAIENLGGVQRMMGLGRAPQVLSKADEVAQFGATPWRTVGKTMLRSGVEEGLEEIPQTFIEKGAGYQDPFSAKNLEEAALGGVLGAIGGGVLGAGHGAARGLRHAQIRRDQSVDLLAQGADLGRISDQAQWTQAFMNKAGENGDAWFNQRMNSVNQQRLGEAVQNNFTAGLGNVALEDSAMQGPFRTPVDELLWNRQREIAAAQRANLGTTPDMFGGEDSYGYIGESSPVDYGPAVNRDRKQMSLDFNPPEAPPPVLYGNQNQPYAESFNNSREGKFNPALNSRAASSPMTGAFTQLPIGETGAQVINRLPASQQVNEAVSHPMFPMPTDVGSALATLQQALGQKTPVIEGTPQHSAILAASQILARAGVKLPKGGRATQTQPVAAQAAATTQQKAQPKPAAAPAAKVTQPRGKFSQAFQARLEAAVAEGKVAPDDPIVTDWHASKKLKADAQSFGQALDDKLAGPTVLPMTAEQALQTKAKNAVAEVKAGGLNLTMKQIPVFEHLQKAFAENRVDDVLGADGKWKYNEIGTALGLARGSVESFVNGVAKRIAEAQGVSVDEMKAALKARTAEVRTTEMSEKDKLGLSPKQQSSVFNEEDLFGNENGAEQNAEVINTVGGSQSAVGTNEAPTDLVVSRPDAPEVVANRAQAAEQSVREAVDEAVNNPRLEEAMNTWDELSEEVKGGAPNRVEIEPMILLEWVDTYSNIVDNHEGKFEKLWGKLQDAHAELIQDSENFNGRTRTENEADRGLPGVQGGQKQIGVSRGEVREVQEGQPVTEQAAGRSDTEGQTGEVSKKKAPKKSYAKTQAEDVAVIDEANKYVTYLGELIAGDMTHRAEVENLLLDKTKGRVIINLIATAKREFPTVLKGVKGHGDLIKFVQAREEAVGDKPLHHRSLKFTDESGVVYEDTVVPINEAKYPRIAGFLDELHGGQLGGVFANVEGFFVSANGDNYAYKNPDGSFVIALSEDIMSDPDDNFVRGVIAHELGHVADNADSRSGGKNSSGPLMGVMVQRAKALFLKLDKSHPLKEFLAYPFSSFFEESKSPKLLRVELYAQLVAAVHNPEVAAMLKQESPALYNFAEMIVNEIEEEYSDQKQTRRQVSVDNAQVVSQQPAPVFSRAAEARGRIQEVAGPTAARLSTDASTIIGRAAKWFMSLHDLIGKYGNMLPSANDWYKSVRATIATRTQLEGDAESIAARAGKLKPKVLEALNKFVADSTFEQKWGFNATFDKIDGTKRSVTADPEMARRFNALPEDARQIAKDMFLHAEAVKLTKFKLLKELGLSGLFDTQGSLQGPYAPLKRFGNYVAVLKSKELLAAEKADDKKLVEELKRDYKHYVVSYFDTKGLAKEFAQKEQAKSGWAYAQPFPKAQHIKETSETSQATLQKVLAAMKVEKDKLPPGSYAMIEEVILDMHMRKFDEDNARMNGLKRKNRYGYDEDMVRAFLSHARAEAGFLANLKHGGKTNELFYKMQFEAGKAKDRDAAMEVFNAISNHYAANIDQRETPIQDRITALTSVMQLATNPAYHLQNLTQPFITSVPRLAADFGDYSGAWKALMDGYRVVRSVGTKNIDLSKVQNLKLRAALQGASDAGLLDVGMDEDLINFEATRTGYAALDTASKGAKKVIHMLRQVSRRVEGANRISAAVAAFNMAQASGKFKDDAAINDYVISVLQDTQGDFSRTDAPLIIKKLPKPLVQYRKFQLMMAAHYVKAFNDAFRSESPEARAVGRRALAYSLGHAFATAGALGIPLMNIVGLIFAHTGDDEPRDLERSLREWIGDDDMAKLLLHGPLWWMGMDAKLAQDKVFSFLPYADWDLTSKEGLKNLGVGLAGPAGSQALKMAGGLEYLSKGDTIKGFEGLLPSGISNGLKAFRIANEGFTLKNGDLMMSPDEINGAALMLDAVGLKSPTMRDLEWTRNQQYEIKEFYQARTKEIQRAYADAYKDGDTDAMTEAREEWMALQEGKDRLRAVFNNSPDELKRQPLSTLLKYPRTQDKREQKLQKSVPE